MCYLSVLNVANVLIVLPVLFRFIVAGQVSQSEAETAKWKKNPITITIIAH